MQEEWADIFIPAVLITRTQYEQLKSLMRLTTCVVEEYGTQLYVPE
jgi:hypothetical protein